MHDVCGLRHGGEREKRSEYLRVKARQLKRSLDFTSSGQEPELQQFVVQVTAAALNEIATSCTEKNFKRAFHVAASTHDLLATGIGNFRYIDPESFMMRSEIYFWARPTVLIGRCEGAQVAGFETPLMAFAIACEALNLTRLKFRRFNSIVSPSAHGVEATLNGEPTTIFQPIVYVRKRGQESKREAANWGNFGLDTAMWSAPKKLSEGIVLVDKQGNPSALKFDGPNVLNPKASSHETWKTRIGLKKSILNF